MKIFYIFAFAMVLTGGVLGEFCIEQGPGESRIWDLTFQFIYGDGEDLGLSEREALLNAGI